MLCHTEISYFIKYSAGLTLSLFKLLVHFPVSNQKSNIMINKLLFQI